MKLSDIREQLERCAKIGVFKARFTENHARLDIPMPKIFGNNDSIAWDNQALIIAALEQFAESRGWFFDLMRRDMGKSHEVSLYKPNTEFDVIEEVVRFAPTRLQAALEAFLSVDWSATK